MQETTQSQIQWMIRKNGPNEPGYDFTSVCLLGPYMTDQVRSMVEQGMLESDDELCPENSYWFFLHEVGEVKRFLGIENLVVRRSPDDEATQPDLANEEKTLPEVVAPDILSIESNVSGEPDSTGIIKINRPAPAKPAQPAPAPVVVAAPIVTTAPAPTALELKAKFPRVPAPRLAPPPNIVRVEKVKFLGALLVFFLALAGAGVIWLIKSLRS